MMCGQCNILSRATRFYCIKGKGHVGRHIDCNGKEIFDGYTQNYGSDKRPHLYFGKEFKEILKGKP